MTLRARVALVTALASVLGIGLSAPAQATGGAESRPEPGPAEAADPKSLVPCVFADDFETGTSCYWSSATGYNGTPCDFCGNGVAEPEAGEQCDDGNVADGDGCSGVCLFEFCGNGTVDASHGEQCDDGNPDDLDGCRNNCQLPACGDGIVSVTEVCDTGGNSASCDYDCTSPVCGDGLVNTLALEECEDGNTQNNDGCTNACKVSFCGDGVTNGREQCDSGGVDTPACNRDCTLALCGDGILNFEAAELCDDANVNNGDGCSATCLVECTPARGAGPKLR